MTQASRPATRYPVPEPARLRLAARLQPLRSHLDLSELRRGPRLLRPRRRLRCRICDYHEPVPGVCPACQSVELARFGYGTEALEREVGGAAGHRAAAARLRRRRPSRASAEVLERFAAPGAKVLVGTQMIAKGHHFPTSRWWASSTPTYAAFPDFRAEERTFAMLVQVGGRSGRGEQPGRVLVQTLDSAARPIALAAAGEHGRFYERRARAARALELPAGGDAAGRRGVVAGGRQGERRRRFRGRALGPPSPRRAGDRTRAASREGSR